MRRLLQLMALVILTLAGTGAGVRAWVGPAIQACRCGCGAISEQDCGCRPPAPAGPSASSTHAPCAPSHAPAGLQALSSPRAGLVETLRGAVTQPRLEPAPWPASLAKAAPAPALGDSRRPGFEGSGPWFPDRQAALGVFRI